VNKRGAYFRYGEMLLGQGRENAKVFLAENPAVLLDLEDQVRTAAGLKALARSETKAALLD
jgi:recombination protein RecA